MLSLTGYKYGRQMRFLHGALKCTFHIIFYWSWMLDITNFKWIKRFPILPISAKLFFTFFYTGTRIAKILQPKWSTALQSVFLVQIWPDADAVRNVVADWLLVLHSYYRDTGSCVSLQCSSSNSFPVNMLVTFLPLNNIDIAVEPTIQTQM